MEERLQKVMARAGIASRRASEKMISEGRVLVNGVVIREMGTKVDPARDVIVVNGELLQIGASRLYIKLNKPVGVISTVSDRWGRKTVLDLVDVPGRVYPVGRLDSDSEGLMLLTNDGEVTARLTHPRYGHEKTYLVLVRGYPDETVLMKLTAGVDLTDEVGKAEDARRLTGVPASAPGMALSEPAGHCWLEIKMLEGRKHEIRRMLQQVGYPVQRLIRIGLGPLQLGGLRPGESRPLTDVERKTLLAAVRRPPGRRPLRKGRRGAPGSGAGSAGRGSKPSEGGARSARRPMSRKGGASSGASRRDGADRSGLQRRKKPMKRRGKQG